MRMMSEGHLQNGKAAALLRAFAFEIFDHVGVAVPAGYAQSGFAIGARKLGLAPLSTRVLTISMYPLSAA